jgi:hypothetical protein
MATILFVLISVTQGILFQQGGTVTGVLRDTQGMPVPGIRIGAVAQSDAVTDASGSAMAGIALTDDEGRFTLENVPPGRYVIAAGRLDRHTFYPGTQNRAEATVLTISPGSTTRGINFVVNSISLGKPEVALGLAWARQAAYEDIVWPEDKSETPRVLLKGVWYELLSVENLPVKDLIEYARRTFPGQWQKRFEEDMVEILDGLGRPQAAEVSLGLRDLTTNQTVIHLSPMNTEHRRKLMLAKAGRPLLPQ